MRHSELRIWTRKEIKQFIMKRRQKKKCDWSALNSPIECIIFDNCVGCGGLEFNPKKKF